MKKSLYISVSLTFFFFVQTVMAASCPDWSSSTSYSAGDKVCYNDQGYEVAPGVYGISGTTYSPDGPFSHFWLTTDECDCGGTPPPEYNLYLNMDGATNGSVEVNGVTYTSSHEFTFEEGEQVTLDAQPDAGYNLDDWGADFAGNNTDPLTFTMDQDYYVEPVYVQQQVPQYTLNVTVSSGQGDVTLNPPGGTYNEGTVVTVTANPDHCWLFSQWGGDLSGSTSPATITMTSNKNVTADFISDPACQQTDLWPSQVDQSGENMKLEGDFNLKGNINIESMLADPLYQLRMYRWDGGPAAKEFILQPNLFSSYYSDGMGYKSEFTYEDGEITIQKTNSADMTVIRGGDITTNGTVTTTELIVTETPTFPDYVFRNNYELPTLKELEDYIKVNKHLPGMPTADEVQEKGLNMGEMQVKLLEKIEEMTLQMIQMQKRIDELEAR